MLERKLNRRDFCRATTAAATIAASTTLANETVFAHEGEHEFRFNYILSSAMYGCMPLNEILPEVKKVGASAIDIWPRVHANQREQIDKMGEHRFAAMLHEHETKLGCLTQYKLGPFHLQDEMRFATRFGCKTIVTGAKGPRGLSGEDLKSAIKKFVEKMKPHLAVAEETNVTIAIENHRNNLIESTDGLKWLRDLRSSKNLGIALAPSHLPQDAGKLAKLIAELGDSIAVFFAWQMGNDFIGVKLPKEEELLQMPGRGDIDFTPIVSALKKIKYSGWTNIFMHPTPRGIPILETTDLVTAEINRSRAYLDGLIEESH